MINVGIIGCGFVGGALKDWLEHNNPECKLFISDPAQWQHLVAPTPIQHRHYRLASRGQRLPYICRRKRAGDESLLVLL